MEKSIYQLILLISLLLLYCTNIYAACRPNPENGKYVSVPNQEIILQYDNTSSSGTLLRKLEVSVYPAGYNMFLSGGSCNYFIQTMYHNGWVANANYIASSNISGIGIRTSYIHDTLLVPNKTSSGYTGGTLNYPGPWKWIIELIKIGPVTTSGTIRSGALASHSITDLDINRTYLISNISFSNNYRITVLSCSLKNSQNTYNINMGDWYDTQFKNINDTQGTVDIPIALSCMSGTNIKVTVTSDTIDNAANGRLGLTGADKATGIAVQLLNNAGTPIVLNQKLTQQNNVAQGDYIFGWKARYIKTANTVTPGTANANATVNIRYE